MNKILMIEEELSTVQKVQERLSLAGFEMFSAHDGRLGFQMAKDKVPDLIITNAVIPLMSGFELCKAIKHDQEINSIPIVVMTEKHRMEESFMFLGVKDFLNKPISMDELENVVRNKLNLSHLMHVQKTKILVYGRNEILTCCQELLKKEPQWIGSFAETKDSLLQNAIKYAPDVILMDLLMPEVSADEMIRKLKLIPELKNTIFLTYYISGSDNRDMITAQAQMIEVQYMKGVTQEAGAKEYLGPFNPVTFMHLLNIYSKDFEV